jgi:hypothetical protein
MTVREPGMERTARRFDVWGLRLIGVALALVVVGIVIWLIGKSTAEWIHALGGMLAWLAVLPGVAGLALLGTAAVSHWGSRHKPFA